MTKNSNPPKGRGPDWGHLGLVAFAGVVSGALFFGSQSFVATPLPLNEIVSSNPVSVEPAPVFSEPDAELIEAQRRALQSSGFDAGVTQ